MIMIFVEPGLEDPASLVVCFKIEGSELRFAAFNILPVEDIALAELDDVGS
jgi:hypothetical protein